MGKKKPQQKNIPKQDLAKPAKVNNQPKVELQKKGLSLWILLTIAAGILAITYFAYQPALDNDFVDWDDNVYVVENPLVRNKQVPTSQIFKEVVSLNYHPLTMLSMRWNANECKDCVYGISAKPFISWNLYLHLLNTLLVFFLAFRLSKENLFTAIFSAVVFALHPMHVESVAWVSERKDVLYVFFFLLGLLSYDKFLQGRYSSSQKTDVKWLFLALIAFVLSCLSKAMAVVFPLLMILMDMYRNPEMNGVKALKQSFSTKKILEYVPFFGIALFFGLMAMSVQSGDNFGGFFAKTGIEKAVNEFDTFSLLQRFQFAAYGFCMYIIKFFAPTGLCTFHPYPTQVEYDSSPVYWGFFVLALAIGALTVFSLRKTKLFVLGIGFYLFTVVLVLQFVSVGVVIMADRYSYLPYIGLAFMLAMSVENYIPKNIRSVFYGIAGIAAVFWFIQTKSQVDSWQDSETLWARVISIYPGQEQPHSIRGNYFGKMASRAAEKNDIKTQNMYMAKAEADFKRAIELKSTRADVYEGMGNIHGMRNEHAKAIEMYNQAIKFNDKKATVYINRGIAYSLSGNQQSSLKDMEKAAELDPKPMHLLYRGIARKTAGNIAAAKADFEAVLKMDPGNKAALEQLNAIK
jgi:tetratricopeptide (TPR) repeat protein